MFDFYQTLQNFINVPAALVGVAAVLAVQWLLPSPGPDKSLKTIPGNIGSRLLPAVAPVTAAVVCVVLEWDGKFTSGDVVKGILSGWGSDWILRFYYKSVKGA
jgi:hypothetical protein